MNRHTAIALLLLVIFTLPAGASHVTVDSSGAGDYTTIASAVVYAVTTGVDTVLVAQGTYSGTDNTEIIISTSPLVIESIGGAAVTIIDGDDQHYAFRFEAGADSTVVVRGFTFDHCLKTSNGGAMQAVLGASPTLDSCLFEACSSTLNGGAIYFHQSASIVRDCVFASNSAGGTGGAIYCYDGGIRLIRCIFRSNASSIADGGGAVHSNSSADLYENCTFVGNGNGTVRLYYSPFTLIRNCVFFGSVSGAAVTDYQGSASAEITHCVSYANSPTDSLPCHRHDNLFVNPLFCDVGTHNYTLCADSQCLPDVNAWSELVGAYGAGCAACDTPVEGVSWGSLKALFR